MTIMTIPQVNGNIKTIGNRGVKLDELIQQTALSILCHVGTGREASLACKLYNKMPAGSRRLALAHWFVKYGQLRINPSKNKDVAKAIPFLFDVDKELNLAGAAEVKWFDAKKEKSLQAEFNLDFELLKFKKVLDKAIKAGVLDAANEDALAVIKAGNAAQARLEAVATA